MLNVEIGDIVLSGRSDGFHRVVDFEEVSYMYERVTLVHLKQVLTSTFKPIKTSKNFKHRVEDIGAVIDTEWLLEKQEVFQKNMSTLVMAMEGDL